MEGSAGVKQRTDGGDAFPTADDATSGMSLRDWFAGQALAGVLACGTMTHPPVRSADNARTAYAMADAMLAERAKPRSGA